MPYKKYQLVVVLFFLLISCGKNKKATLFTLQDNKEIGIGFINQLNDLSRTNVFAFRNYYNGGGVAIGDLNNDGLNDVFMTSNQGGNKLYINKGNWKFEDVTEKAGVKGTKYWSTGATLVDINGDGWLDIYVCHSGNGPAKSRGNELFINQHDGTFKEEAEKYGLTDNGLSTQAIFFDYDNDGDLDCFVLNNSFRPIGTFDFTQNLRTIFDKLGGARLYRNDNGHFTNVTKEAGIYSSDIGFGLGVSVVDINQDGYPDLYVSNDFFERDYLYINQKNGTFKEEIQDETGHLSLASMGSDIADINNDGQYDIFTTEMLPEGDKRLKKMTAFESYDENKLKQRDGFFNQYSQNCLQLNNGDNTFSEIAFHSGIAATDWSWGALMFDMNNDGWKDIFVCNGIYKDLTDQDYIEFLSNKENMAKVKDKKKFDYKDFTDKMTSTPLPNYAFLNNRDLTFSNKAEEFGIATPSFSNGAAYADLDNDGDNDLVINNVNMPPFIYKNNSNAAVNHFIQVKLQGTKMNSFGIGTTIKIFNKNTSQIYYNQPTRGFQSCTSPNLLTIGLGKNTSVDSIQIIWPGGKYEVQKSLKANKVYTFKITNALLNYDFTRKLVKPIFKESAKSLFDSIPRHHEDDFVDFDNEKLMLQKLSTQNPYMASGDINGDGLKDFYFGSSKGNNASIYIQQKNGHFKQYVPEDFEKSNYLENAGAVFGDFDNDGDQDLIVAVGGNADEAGTPIYFPRFYENDGKGHFKWNQSKTIHAAINASVICAADYDKDGSLDLFVGGLSVPGLYGSAPKSYVFHNDGAGHFKDVSKEVLGNDTHLGMVTAAKWADLDNNGYPDLVVAGNWMGIKIFMNNHGRFTEDKQLENYKGWWSSLEVADVDGDGKPDIIAGNLGTNSKFRASFTEPMKIYIKDFDNNGTKECVTSMYRSDHVEYTFNMKPDLVGQMPLFKKRFLNYIDYAGKPFREVFTPDMLDSCEVHEMNYLQSAVFFNSGSGKFTCKALPSRAQFSPINTIVADDVDNSGKNTLIMGGNFFDFKPEIGRLDASYGLFYKYINGQFVYTEPAKSGIMLRGQVRSSLVIKNSSGAKYYLFGQNDDQLKVFQINK
ncbi:VCBS repeat-containing protein [Mucilaginibacter sp. BJC16-A38]|uniref:VCBS repeat-containing protein n=1 Tax=Mucilaginibacter phenanthrenivorans TaxID=1234842 RepID=UPI0021579197|nr:VCBS repeat-containing protein [Mucilaginibacter phenanthrenivorans]MCR8560253.1 VCBS repeat-containing protein [Mucilaginibacter phenanthrenivorans]